MPTTLLTGANNGLGREAALWRLARGHDVWLTARDPDRGPDGPTGAFRAGDGPW